MNVAFNDTVSRTPHISLIGICGDYMLIQYIGKPFVPIDENYYWGKATHCDSFIRRRLVFSYCIECISKASEEMVTYVADNK